MIYQIYPKKDTTIYEKINSLNTGLDAILEVSKTLESVLDTNNIPTLQSYASRILMQFDYSDLNTLIDAGFDTASIDSKYELRLYAVQEKQLPTEFTLEVDTISGSWYMGLGRYDYIPYVTSGSSWKYKYSKTDGTIWATASFSDATGSWNIVPGGGNWYTATSLITSKSFSFNETTDPVIDISDIVNAHLKGTITNNGILIRRPDSEERSVSDDAVLQYFSSDTNTIYLPHILVKWNDWSFNTGSLLGIDVSSDNVVYFKNLKNTYTIDDRIKFRISGRPRYPVKTFSTASVYSVEYYLPASSSYSVEDLHTKQIVIPYDDIYTRISCDSTGSYFNFWMGALQPERWYKFGIKTKFNSGDVRIYNTEYIFKVERRD